MTQFENKQQRIEWLNKRKTGIGGSDISSILGLNPYKTPLQLWVEKTNQDGSYEDYPSEAAYWGNRLENIVAEEYEKRAQCKTQVISETITHPEYPFMFGHIDRAVVNPDIRETVQWDKTENGSELSTDRILECKTASSFLKHAWGETTIPTMYYIQCMWYLALTNVKYADIAVLIGGQEFRTYTIERKEPLVSHLVKEAKNFWTKVEEKVPPKPIDTKDLEILYPENKELKSIEVGENVAQLCKQLEELKKKENLIKNVRDTLELELKKVFEDAEILTYQGEKLATWKTQNRTYLDTARLKKDKPWLAEEYSGTKKVRILHLLKKPAG